MGEPNKRRRKRVVLLLRAVCTTRRGPGRFRGVARRTVAGFDASQRTVHRASRSSERRHALVYLSSTAGYMIVDVAAFIIPH